MAWQNDFMEGCVLRISSLIESNNLNPTEQEAIDAAPERRISAARVQFYTAEIILALAHLHDLGLMYRDLKV